MIIEFALAAGAFGAFFVFMSRVKALTLPSVVAKAQGAGDFSAVVAFIDAYPEAGQGTQWDQAIGQLWQAYAREDAARLIVEAAQRSEAPVVQYWIRQVLEIEPEIAEAHFSAEFMAEYFRPEVALACGKGCGCG